RARRRDDGGVAVRPCPRAGGARCRCAGQPHPTPNGRLEHCAPPPAFCIISFGSIVHAGRDALDARARGSSEEMPAAATVAVISNPLEDDQDDQRHRWISLLKLLISETDRCRSRASKVCPKRLSGNGTSRSIAATGTAWRNLLGARC